MDGEPKLLDTIALLKKIPGQKLIAGQVGTVVERLDRHTFLVEFCNHNGETLAIVSVKSDNMLLLHYDLIAA